MASGSALTDQGVDHGLAETHSVTNLCEAEQTIGRLRDASVCFGRHMRDSVSPLRTFAKPRSLARQAECIAAPPSMCIAVF